MVVTTLVKFNIATGRAGLTPLLHGQPQILNGHEQKNVFCKLTIVSLDTRQTTYTKVFHMSSTFFTSPTKPHTYIYIVQAYPA